MKKMKFSTMMLTVLLLAGTVNVCAADGPSDQSGDIKILCSPALENLAKDFSRSWSPGNGKVDADVLALHSEQMNNELAYPGRVALVTKEQLGRLSMEALRVSVIGREVYVPVMNAANPFIDEIRKTGLSPEEFAIAYSSHKVAWNDILPNSRSVDVHAFRIADPSFESYLNDFIGSGEKEASGKILPSCEDVMQAVSSDRYAIGFCTLSQLRQMESFENTALAVIPVDMDGNNQIDNFEQYFGSVDELARGIWIGKYPSSLYSRIYAVYNARVSGETEKALLRWMVTDGQQYFAENGYSALLANEQESILAGIDQPAVTPVPGPQAAKRSTTLLLLASLIIAGFIIVFLVLRAFDSSAAEKESGLKRFSRTGFQSDPSLIPGGYYFDKSHTWTFMEKDGNLSVGVDQFLTHVTGRITKVQLKQPGEKVKKGEPVLSIIQNGKTMQVASPVTGTIREVNNELLGNAALLSMSPLDEGWLYLVEPADWQTEMKAFFMRDKYVDWVKGEFTRLKDFMMTTLKPLAGTQVVLQEGGEVKQALLEELGPEAWEEFQTGFLKIKS